MSRLAVMYPDPDHATACAENENVRSIAGLRQEERIKEGIDLCRAWDQSKLVEDLVADPTEEAALFYQAVARNWDDLCEIGKIAKRIVENRYREKAEFLDSMRRD